MRDKHHTMHHIIHSCSIWSVLTVLVLCGTMSMGILNSGIHSSEDYSGKEYNRKFVDNLLLHCLNRTPQMQENREDSFFVCYRSGAITLHNCFGKLYVYFENNYEKKNKEGSWDNVFGQVGVETHRFSTHFVSEILDPQPVRNDSAVETGCQLDFGSLSRMPSITMCFIQQNNKTRSSKLYETTNTSCDAQSHKVIPLYSNLPCSHSQHATTMLHFKAAWVLAKVNYGLIISTILCVLLPTMLSTLIRIRTRNSRPVLLFGVLNVLWMMWRLQETLQWDTKWQDDVPYICVATNTLQYLVEALALFLFACTSLGRYQAISSPLLNSVTKNKVKMVVLSLIVGVITGSICSVLNMVALSVMTSPPALLLKRCNIPNNVHDKLIILIIAKVLSLLVMYLVPCGIMSTANIGMFLSLRRERKKKLGRCYSRKQKSRKTSMISSFLVFSSVFMVCCVSKPIFEVYLAIRIHMGVSYRRDLDTIGILLDAITWNLTTIAFIINAVMGIRYTN